MTAERDYMVLEAERLAAHVQRTEDRLLTLAERYSRLREELPAGGHRGNDDDRRRSKPGPRLPLRVDVLDLIEAVEDFTDRLGPLVRGTLRIGTAPVYQTRADAVWAALGVMRRGLMRVYAEDWQLGDDVSRRAWLLERRTGELFGEVSRPFPLTERCPSCAMPSLWVVPDRLVIRCGNPACAAERSVHAVIPVYVSASDLEGGPVAG